MGQQVPMGYCVDASSAILRSGIHYGDKSETLDEWQTPVTIVGSHACELKFFEPMFSWKWASDCITDSSWPLYDVHDITYTAKGIESLPDEWSIEVSEGCKADTCHPNFLGDPLDEVCHIKMTMEGDKCPEGGCSVQYGCGEIIDCDTDELYETNWIDCAEDLDGDGDVSFNDLLHVLSDWGVCENELGCPSDLDKD